MDFKIRNMSREKEKEKKKEKKEKPEKKVQNEFFVSNSPFLCCVHQSKIKNKFVIIFLKKISRRTDKIEKGKNTRMSWRRSRARSLPALMCLAWAFGAPWS